MTAADLSRVETSELVGTGERRLSRALVLTIAFGAVLQALNASTMAVALVDIRDQFDAGAAASWMISGLYLATAVGSPTAGRLADLFGSRRVFLASLALTLVASAAAPLAPNLGWLIAFRVLLGIGTCAAFPAGVAMLRAEADRLGVELPTAALSVLAIGGQVMVAFGPVVGGVLVQYWGWRSIFLMNLPLAAVVIVMALVWLPRDRGVDKRASVWGRLDLVGAGLFAATVAVLMLFLLSLSERPQWWWLPVLAVVAAAFVAFELRAREPFVDVRMLAGNRALSGTYLRTALTYVAFYMVFFGFPMWLQSARGLPPGQVGLVVLPIALLAMASVAVAGRVLPRMGHWPVLVAGSAMLLAGGVGLILLDATAVVGALVAVAAVLGVPNGFNNIGNQSALYRQAAARDAGIAAGLFRTSQYVGANIAAAMIELCFAGPVSDPGLHRLGGVVAGISAVLLVGALVGLVVGRRFR
ncbi:MFS transporter [Saccharopolyspora phatthalungensis]|uniref:MFS family permease n=1 Tax=Saccharopolyspora phatthalungensis TaxID=664693 RepID=A0A840QDU2_9PSEU|nr:MFS transporter [Saccharopolyspora phatthalungensis]MBB5158177.1 MFS family permease [Saccharopolyspora phatthalungensis]